MAERVDKVPEHKPRMTSKYPWDEWFDGSIWELIPGKDFEGHVEPMRSTVKSAAAVRQVTVTFAVRGDRVYVQAQK